MQRRPERSRANVSSRGSGEAALKKMAMEFADHLADNVSCATQIPRVGYADSYPDRELLANEKDWIRNAESLFLFYAKRLLDGAPRAAGPKGDGE